MVGGEVGRLDDDKKEDTKRDLARYIQRNEFDDASKDEDSRCNRRDAMDAFNGIQMLLRMAFVFQRTILFSTTRDSRT